MKCSIDIVTGFFESGKSNLINSLIKETTVKEEKIVVIQLEEGNTVIEKEVEVNLEVIKFDEELMELEGKLEEIITLYNPTKILIEFNGTENINELLDYIHNRGLRCKCNLGCIYFICNMKNIHGHLRNMGELINPFIENSNLIIVNNSKLESKESKNEAKKALENISKSGHIIFSENNAGINKALKDSGLFGGLFLKKIYYKIKGQVV